MSRSTSILIALLVVLAAVTYFLLPSSDDREASYKSIVPSIKVDSASVVKIEMKQSTKKITLENVGGKWMITTPINAPADPLAVFALLNGFAKFTVGSLISSNPEKQHIFQVDSTGTILTLTERGGKSTTIIAGKMGPSFSEIYFRLPDSKDVYLSSGVDNWTINKNVREWRDKSILQTSMEAINEVSITMGSKNTVFKHGANGWKSGETTVDANTINPLLTTLSDLHADDFVDSAVNLIGRPITLGVKAFEQIELSMYPVSSDTVKYFVRTSKSPQVYVLSKWTVDQLLKPIGKSSVSLPMPITENPKKNIRPEQKKSAKISPKPVKTVVVPDEHPQKQVVATSPVVQEPKKEKSQPQPVIVKQIQPTAQPERKIEDKPAPKIETKQAVTEEDEGELTIHVVKAGETMTTIAKKYNVTTERILKWNLLKSISVKPGQELYVYIKK